MHRSQLNRIALGLGFLMMLAAVYGCGRTSISGDPPSMERVIALRDAMGGEASADSSGGAISGGAQPTGWATLKGRFTISGDPPARLQLSINKDAAVCAPAGKKVLSEALVVGDGNGIKDVVIFLNQSIPAEEPWSHPDMAPGKTDEVVFDQEACVFLSHVLPMQTSQTLLVKNSDPVGHNTKLSPKKNAGFDRTVAANGTATYQPKKEEPSPFSVVCAVHPWMSAYIIIRDNSYIAVTAPDGTFEIPKLPAGVELEFRVWQEASKFIQDVQVNGESTEWKKGRVVMTLDSEDLAKNELSVVVDASVFE